MNISSDIGDPSDGLHQQEVIPFVQMKWINISQHTPKTYLVYMKLLTDKEATHLKRVHCSQQIILILLLVGK